MKCQTSNNKVKYIWKWGPLEKIPNLRSYCYCRILARNVMMAVLGVKSGCTVKHGLSPRDFPQALFCFLIVTDTNKIICDH